jgi:hypothetical protein
MSQTSDPHELVGFVIIVVLGVMVIIALHLIKCRTPFYWWLLSRHGPRIWRDSEYTQMAARFRVWRSPAPTIPTGFACRTLWPDSPMMKSDREGPDQGYELCARDRIRGVRRRRSRPCRSSCLFRCLFRPRQTENSGRSGDRRRARARSKVSVRNASPVVMTADMIRASLLARATVTSLAGLRARRATSQSRGEPLPLPATRQTRRHEINGALRFPTTAPEISSPGVYR